MSTSIQQDPWTIKRLLDWTADFFKSKDLDSPRLCAEILLAEALGCARIELYTRFDQIPEEPGLGLYRDWVKRHAKGEPVAYLVGHKEFYSLKFEVSSDVLIPRPETEHLVLAAIDSANAMPQRDIKIVDVGTGSGCVSIALAKHLEQSQILAVDISDAALQVAERNAIANQANDQITFLNSDVLVGIPQDFRADIIVSNPPYIGTKEFETVDESVKRFEPEIALFAGDEGTDVIEKLVEQSAQRMVPGGFLIFETSPIIFDRCLEIVAACGAFVSPQTIKDYSGHRRIIKATLKTA